MHLSRFSKISKTFTNPVSPLILTHLNLPQQPRAKILRTVREPNEFHRITCSKVTRSRNFQTSQAFERLVKGYPAEIKIDIYSLLITSTLPRSMHFPHSFSFFLLSFFFFSRSLPLLVFFFNELTLVPADETRRKIIDKDISALDSQTTVTRSPMA